MAIKSNKLGAGTLKFGSTGDEQEFASQVTAVKLSPTINEEDDIDVLSGETLDGDETEEWTLNGTFLQDYSGLASLIVWCKENSGITMPFVFTPTTEAGLTVKGKVKIRPVEIGGDVKSRNTTDFDFKGVDDYTYSATPGE